MRNRDELKPCPLCGSTTATVFRPTCDRKSPYDPSDRAFPIVRCMTCYTEVAGDDFDASCQSARDKWNRRPGLSAALSEQTLPVRVKAVAWFMHLWNEADEDVKSDVRWGRPTGDDISRAEHNGHDIEHLYAHPPVSALVNAQADADVVDLSEVIAKIKDCGDDSQPGSEYRLACDDLIELFSALRSSGSAEVGSATETSGTGGGE